LHLPVKELEFLRMQGGLTCREANKSQFDDSSAH
jgi:hypothetical protein